MICKLKRLASKKTNSLNSKLKLHAHIKSYVGDYQDSVELMQNYDKTHEVIENIGTGSVLTWSQRWINFNVTLLCSRNRQIPIFSANWLIGTDFRDFKSNQNKFRIKALSLEHVWNRLSAVAHHIGLNKEWICIEVYSGTSAGPIMPRTL